MRDQCRGASSGQETGGGRREFGGLYRLVVCALLALGSCKKATDATSPLASGPDAVVVVQGNAQSVQAGKDLPLPVIFRVLDKSGAAMKNVAVAIVVVSGGGAVDPASGVTDAKGEVKAKWTLGPSIAEQSIQASAGNAAPATVEATGILPSTIILAQGNNQTAKVGGALPNSIVVRVVGGANIPMQGVAVGFQVLAGGGAMSPQTVVTNALGEAVTKWTVGTIAGVNTAMVVAQALNPVNLTATAIP